MRIFTCTPVSFRGDASFFSRDSGLMCRGLQAIACESQAVMPGELRPDDEADLIRTDYANLESASWWRAQKIDGLVLYAWGSPQYRKIAKAIREAGIFLILNQDNGGLISPLASIPNWLREQWILSGQGRSANAIYHFTILWLRGLSIGLLRTDPLRAQHLKCGNVIACVSPKAAEHYRKLCQFYGGEKLANLVRVIPHAVESYFRFSGAEKKRQVICIGRWQDEVQKRPWRLMEVIASLLKYDPKVSVIIAGQKTPQLETWLETLPQSEQNRVVLTGIIPREVLFQHLQESQVFYSSSGFESFSIAAAEALCCGCSIVAGKSVSMTSFEWFVSENSGRLAGVDRANSHCQAIFDELSAWQAGERDPMSISEKWAERLHADQVAKAVVREIESARLNSAQPPFSQS